MQTADMFMSFDGMQLSRDATKAYEQCIELLRAGHMWQPYVPFQIDEYQESHANRSD
jgi:hypothetical protein